ncbi:MAG: insulinase family protein [Planctomycetota bacterium]
MLSFKLRRASLLLCLMVVAAAPLAAAEDLLSDARVKSGTLANGVRWLYRQHNVPPGKLAMLVHVGTGSLNETDEQRGLAHFLEHMAFNGTEHFPPGKLIPFFESIGMAFGPDLNAFTSFDQTAYMVFLPNTETAQADDALKVLSDYVFRMSLLPEEIDKERGVILSELRAGKSAHQRLNDQMMKRVFAGTRLGERIPIGVEEVIKNAPPERFAAYYRGRYRPERITLLLIGDADLDPYVPLIEKWFGEYRAPGPAQPDLGPDLKPFTAERAIVLSDPEYAEGDVDLYNLSPGRPPTTTVAAARQELLEEIGTWIVNRRLAERVRKGIASYRQGYASVSRLVKEGLLVNASTTGEPQTWEKMLEELVAEVNRAREFGFLPGELELARRALLSEAEDAVQKEPTQNARMFLFRYMRCVNDREPIRSAQQDLELLQKLLPGVALDEVNRAFAAHFAPGTFAYVLTMPQKEDVKLPTEDELLAAARAAQARKVEPPEWEERPTALLEKEPTPAKLVESTRDEALGITSGWLANGVRLHHRFMDYKKDTVYVTIGLAGGPLEETLENAGTTGIAALAFNQAATSRLTSSEIRDIMTGKRVSLRAMPQDDVLMVTVSGSPADLEIGLQLAHALLTDGKLEQSAFDNWKQAALQQYAMFSQRTDLMAFDTMVKLLSGGDPRRIFMITPEQVARLSLPAAQAWLERLRRSAPIEASVVGEMQFDAVLPLIEKYIGGLPARPRSAEHLAALRELRCGAGPLEKRIEVPTVTPKGMTVSGFRAADTRNVTDVRALDLLANICDSRLVKRVREELGMVYSISARNNAGSVYRDSGFVFCGAPCDPEKTEELAREIEAIFADLAAQGPTPEELENAKKQWQNKLDQLLKEPTYWSGQLQTLDLRGMKLDDLKDIPAQYAAYTPEQVLSVFRKYYVPQRQFRVYAVPAAAPATTAPTPASQPVAGK